MDNKENIRPVVRLIFDWTRHIISIKIFVTNNSYNVNDGENANGRDVFKEVDPH